jgi:hypothetical protein
MVPITENEYMKTILKIQFQALCVEGGFMGV